MIYFPDEAAGGSWADMVRPAAAPQLHTATSCYAVVIVSSRPRQRHRHHPVVSVTYLLPTASPPSTLQLLSQLLQKLAVTYYVRYTM